VENVKKNYISERHLHFLNVAPYSKAYLLLIFGLTELAWDKCKLLILLNIFQYLRAVSIVRKY
jgi:hypothetical protein